MSSLGWLTGLALSGAWLVACTGKISSVDYESVDYEPVRVGAGGVRASAGEGGARTIRGGAAGTGGTGNSGVIRADAGTVGGAPSTAGGRGGASSGGAAGASDDEIYCDAVTDVFTLRCGGGSCHSNSDATIGDFAAGREQAESFVDVPSVRNADCGMIIDSSDPAESLIFRKLIGDFPSPMCGGFMPVSGDDLTDDQIDCVASWVRQFRK